MYKIYDLKTYQLFAECDNQAEADWYVTSNDWLFWVLA